MPGTPPLQNLEPVESKLRKKMQGCWRQFLKECKEKDGHKQGEIAASEFLGSFWSLGSRVVVSPPGARSFPPWSEAGTPRGDTWGLWQDGTLSDTSVSGTRTPDVSRHPPPTAPKQVAPRDGVST